REHALNRGGRALLLVPAGRVRARHPVEAPRGQPPRTPRPGRGPGRAEGAGERVRGGAVRDQGYRGGPRRPRREPDPVPPAAGEGGAAGGAGEAAGRGPAEGG